MAIIPQNDHIKIRGLAQMQVFSYPDNQCAMVSRMSPGVFSLSISRASWLSIFL
jgi:hypothetical protein